MYPDLVIEFLNTHVITEDWSNDDVIASIAFWKRLNDIPTLKISELREIIYEVMTILGRTPRTDYKLARKQE